jgi:hypothetical protein
MGAYVAAYGEEASLFVAVEKYTQNVTYEGRSPFRPRRLVAEFAIVKATGSIGWIGFRDVVEVNGEKIGDRRDRLERLLMNPAGDGSEVIKISNESSRFNVGPISRNFNVPTTTLFFFHPSSLSRFTFSRKGTKKIEGIDTWELEFKETKRPTLIRTRKGRDVPCEGRVWVVPDDGTVVRTRLRLRGFADEMAPPPPPPIRPKEDFRRLESLADIEVTYRRDTRLRAWLPSKMSETYEGALPAGTGQPILGRAMTVATYSEFKRFETSAKISVPK